MAEQMCMWVIPPLPGQVVILNPEDERYESYLSHVGIESGVVTGLRERLVDEWHVLGESNKRDAKAYVTFDNGRTIELRLKSLLPISNLFKDVIRTQIRGGGEVYDTAEKATKRLDQVLIVEGRTLVNYKLWNHEKRMDLLRNSIVSHQHYARRGELDEIRLATYTEYIKIGAIEDAQQDVAEPVTPSPSFAPFGNPTNAFQRTIPPVVDLSSMIDDHFPIEVEVEEEGFRDEEFIHDDEDEPEEF